MKRFKIVYRLELKECPNQEFERQVVIEEKIFDLAFLVGAQFRDKFCDVYGEGSCTLLMIEEL